jgi:glutamine---fructose-6-phosphate transaminase (isomerizing)
VTASKRWTEPSDKPEVHTIAWDAVSAEKGEYRHFMQKEIHEQVRALTDTLAGRVDFATGRIRLPELNLTPKLAKRIERIYITACGTAAYAGMVGKIPDRKDRPHPGGGGDRLRIPLQRPDRDENTVVLAISQSGETADTLAAMEEGRKKGAHHLEHRQRHRLAGHAHRDGYISMQTGPEIGVASTKAFTAPLVTSTCWRSCWQTCAA